MEKPAFSRALFTSIRDDWRTPRSLYEKLDSEFHFDYDPCPPNPAINGLFSDWGQRNFVNPPYGRQTPAWVNKAFSEWQRGKLVVMLLASRTDTKWFQDIILPYSSEIRFLRGRLKFDDSNGRATFPSMVVVFDRESKARRKTIHA
jgi:site-specific DNA-methyltransferase (adenine-specific)